MATVLVRGRASADVPPDRVRLVLAVAAEAAAAVDALSALAARSAALDAALGRVELLLRRPSAVTLGPLWSPQGEVTGQAARRAVTVEAAAAGPLGDLLAVVAQVPGASVDGVEWLVDPANPAHGRLRGQAVADARERAADYARAAGRPLGAVEQISEPGLSEPGPPVFRAMAMAKESGPGGGPVLELRPEPVPVSAEVDVRYGLLAE
jgi:uncharacterized protein